MEGDTALEMAYQIMGDNIIGPIEILNNVILSKFLNIDTSSIPPNVKYSKETLQEFSNSHVLFLVIPEHQSGGGLRLEHFVKEFGFDPAISEPCFYNQDWYLNELFYKGSRLKWEWILISKEIDVNTRAMYPEDIAKVTSSLPSALLCAYVFFSYYLIKNKILWENDFVWCSDTDVNNDQIYVGRYKDPTGKSKNGFSIHRHLKIRPNYGAVNLLS